MVNCLNMFFFCNKSAAPVVDGLDPNGLIMYRLYRDATLYTDGTHVKVRIPVDRDQGYVASQAAQAPAVR